MVADTHARAGTARAKRQNGTRSRTVGPVSDTSSLEQPDLARMLAHELLNSLTVIGGYAATLRVAGKNGSADLALQCAEVIERHAGQMEALIRASQDVRLLDTGTMELSSQPLDLVDTVREAVEAQGKALEQHRVVVTAARSVPVRADPVRLRQAVSALLTNAAKFAPEGTAVDVTVSSEDGVAAVVVSDEGPGIPADKRERVFEKFGRLSHKTPGAGLGLFIARGITWLHGGDLVVGEAEGGGASFALTLPLRRPPA